jgi:hypothetical protein
VTSEELDEVPPGQQKSQPSVPITLPAPLSLSFQNTWLSCVNQAHFFV